MMSRATHGSYRPQWQGSHRKNNTGDVADIRLIACVAASLVAMTFLGTYLVALFYALWLPWAMFRPKQVLPPSRELLLPAMIVAYFLLSVLWSVHRDVTARAALEFASMIGCTVIVARLVSAASFIKGVVLGACAVLVVVLVTAGGLPEGTALVGSLGSKNQVGAVAELGCYCALLMWFASKKLTSRIFLSLAPLSLFVVCLYFSHSATSDMSLVAMLCVSYAAYFVGRLPKKFRVPVFSFAIVCMVVVAVAAAAFDWQSLVPYHRTLGTLCVESHPEQKSHQIIAGMMVASVSRAAAAVAARPALVK